MTCDWQREVSPCSNKVQAQSLKHVSLDQDGRSVNNYRIYADKNLYLNSRAKA